MILTETLNIKVINHTLEHFKNLGYNVKYGDTITIPIYHLNIGSHYLIDVKCNKCESIKNMKYQDYIKITNNHSESYYCQTCVKTEKTTKTVQKLYGVSNVSKSNIIKKQKEKTTLKNYGVKNPFESEVIKNRIKITNVNLYGYESATQNENIQLKSKITRLKNGNQISDDQLTEYEKYRKIVLKETRKHINNLLNNWDGCDFYDNEYIKEYYNLNYNDKKYPNIDHKISIFEGFTKNIDYKIIGNIKNLCITKRTINSTKNKKSYYD
jgi:hypothetical protein